MEPRFMGYFSIIWMMIYYGKAGWYANIALALTYFSYSDFSKSRELFYIYQVLQVLF
jgi:hypothetical protein